VNHTGYFKVTIYRPDSFSARDYKVPQERATRILDMLEQDRLRIELVFGEIVVNGSCGGAE